MVFTVSVLALDRMPLRMRGNKCRSENSTAFSMTKASALPYCEDNGRILAGVYAVISAFQKMKRMHTKILFEAIAIKRHDRALYYVIKGPHESFLFVFVCLKVLF